MIAEPACSWTRWVSRDLDVLESRGAQLALELVGGQGAGDAAGPLLHVGPGGLVHVGVGDDVGDGEAPAGRSTRAASAKTAGLSPERLITQLEMITSTESSGSGTFSIVPLRNSAFSTPASRWFARAIASISSVMSRPYALPARADPPRREEDVDAAAGAQVEDGLALVQLGDGGRVAAAERGQLRRLGQGVALGIRVELRPEVLAVAPQASGMSVPQPHDESEVPQQQPARPSPTERAASA